MRGLIMIALLLCTMGATAQQIIVAKQVTVTDNFLPPLDTVVAPKYLYEIRFRVQDSALYNAMSLTGKKWYKNTFTPASLTHYIDSLFYSSDTLTVVSGTATLDFPSVPAGGVSTLTVTVAGAADGDAVALGIPSVSYVAGLVFLPPRVSATGVVSVSVYNSTGGSLDPPPGIFKVKIIQ